MRALIALVLGPGAAPAQTAFSWDAPADACPSEAAVVDRLTDLLGPRTLAAEAAARARPIDGRYRLTLRVRWRDVVDEQVLEADTCDDLAEAAALLVAMLAEPRAAPAAGEVRPIADEGAPRTVDVGEGERSIEDASDVAFQGERESVPTAPHDADPGGPPRRARRGLPRGPALSLLGVADLGSLPGIAGGVAATVTMRWPRARVFVGGAYLPPRAVPDPPAYSARGRAQLGFVRVGACVRLGAPRVEVPLCGAVEVGGSSAAGFGLAGDRGARDPWVAAALMPALVVPIHRQVALRVGVDVVVPLLISRYVYGDTLVHETAPVIARGGLGLEFHLSSENSGGPENR